MEKRLDELVKARDEAQAAHELAHQLMKNRIRGKTTTFKIGDKVWLEARNLRRNMVDPKFTPKCEGPFKIKKVLSTLSYQLELPKSWKIHPTFYISLLSPYKETETHGPNYIRPPPELVNGEEEYEVERIPNDIVTSLGGKDMKQTKTRGYLKRISEIPRKYSWNIKGE